MQQRVVGFGRLDLGERQVGGCDVCARMTIEANRMEVQERRPP